MALTANREVDHYIDQELRSFQVAGSKHILKGALLGLDSDSYARPLSAGDLFVGVAYEEMDNSSGLDGDVSVRAYTMGDFGHPLSGAALTDIGRPVFASSDDTLTFTASGNSFVGIVQDVVATGEIILRTDPSHRQLKTVTHAVENLGAGSDIAARAIHVFDASGWIVSARVVNQATVAAGINDGNTCVIALAHAGGTVASITFDSTTSFPNANTDQSMGTISNGQVVGKAILTLAVTNGASANPGEFLVEVDYV